MSISINQIKGSQKQNIDIKDKNIITFLNRKESAFTIAASHCKLFESLPTAIFKIIPTFFSYVLNYNNYKNTASNINKLKKNIIDKSDNNLLNVNKAKLSVFMYLFKTNTLEIVDIQKNNPHEYINSNEYEINDNT